MSSVGVFALCFLQESLGRGPFLETGFGFRAGGFPRHCPEMPLVLGPKVCPRAHSILPVVFGSFNSVRFLCERVLRNEPLQGYWVSGKLAFSLQNGAFF